MAAPATSRWRSASFGVGGLVGAIGLLALPRGVVRAGFSATASLSRKGFGLTWNQALETGGVMVGDRVDVEIELEAIKQAAAEVA
jgi:hypothetical protein